MRRPDSWERLRILIEVVDQEHRASRVVQAKYRALYRLYHRLTVVVVLAMLLLVAYAVWGSVP